MCLCAGTDSEGSDSCTAGARSLGKFRFSLCLCTISSSVSPGPKTLSVLFFSRDHNCKYIRLLVWVQCRTFALPPRPGETKLFIMLVATAVNAGRAKVNQKTRETKQTGAYGCANAICVAKSSAFKTSIRTSFLKDVWVDG